MQPGSSAHKRSAPRTTKPVRVRPRGSVTSSQVRDEKNGDRNQDGSKDDPTEDVRSSGEPPENPQLVRLLRRPRSRAVAPYLPGSERADARLQELIHHYTTVVAVRTVTPVGPRHEWFPFAAEDEALFHAVMSHTAAHSAYLRKESPQKDAVYFWHIGQAIRLVNERLREGAGKATAEGTICAVCCLTQQQAFAGNVDNARMHLNGLLQLVRAAGGIHSFRMNPKTRRFVLLTDLASSITLRKRFCLQPMLYSSSLVHYFGPPTLDTESYANTLSARLYNFSESSVQSAHALEVYWGLRNISLLLEDIRAGLASPDTQNAHEMQFTDRVEVLERCAHKLWYHEPIPSSTASSPVASRRNSIAITLSLPDPNHTIFRLLGHATLIYIYTTLRELPPELGMLKLVARRIMTELEKCPDLNVLLATFQDLMIWIMFQAGSVAGPRERVFFASQVSKILIVNRVEEELEIVAAAHRFLWPESMEMTAPGPGPGPGGAVAPRTGGAMPEAVGDLGDIVMLDEPSGD